jgi:hypothetical protein
MKKAWEQLEEEYGVPIRDLLTDLLFNPYAPLTYADAAAILNVHRNTLGAWRKALRIEARAPIRYPPENRFVDRQAQAKGYVDIEDAIRDLKLNKKMVVEAMSSFLEISVRSIVYHTPHELKGIQNRSQAGLEVLQETRKRINGRLPRGHHPWKLGT